MDDKEHDDLTQITEGDWENAHELTVTDEMNNRIVRAVGSATAIWSFQNPETDEGTPLPIMVLDLTTDEGPNQTFLPPQAFAALMGECANHIARLWGMPKAIVNSDDIETFLDRMTHNNTNDNDNNDGYEPGGYV